MLQLEPVQSLSDSHPVVFLAEMTEGPYKNIHIVVHNTNLNNFKIRLNTYMLIIELKL